MKGIKLGIIGITLALLGISFSTNNILCIGVAFIGLVLAIQGFFIKD